ELARAVHVGNAIGPEALCPIVEAAGLGVVNQSQGLRDTVSSNVLPVKVQLDVRDQRLPAQLQEQLRIVKRTSRSVDDVAMDAAILTIREWLLAEFQEGG